MAEKVSGKMSERAPRIRELDLLRFIAAALVVVYHYVYAGPVSGEANIDGFHFLRGMAKYGHTGVYLFFLISGFVIIMSIKGANLRAFIASRCSRLYPAFWVCCTLTFLVVVVANDPRHSATIGQYLVNLTMLSRFLGVTSIDGAYWSLYVEIGFYVLAAAIVVLKLKGRLPYVMAAWLAVAALARVVTLPGSDTLLLASYASFFVGGAMLYLIWEKGGSPLLWGIVGLSWALSMVHAVRLSKTLSNDFHDHHSAPINAVLFTLAYVALALIATGHTGWFARQDFKTLGALTYPLYLIHQRIGYIVFDKLGTHLNNTLLVLMMMAAAMGIAWLVNRFVERPLAPWMRRVIAKGPSFSTKRELATTATR
jgi:peptidoglycan/LPS O-acetylase OafA/YrhL